MILEEMLKYQEFVIQCHDFPDADTLACGYALGCYLKEHGKSVRVVYSGKAPIAKQNLLLLVEQFKIPVEYISELKKTEVLVLVDCCYGEGNVTQFEAEHVFVIDHHLCSYPRTNHVEIRSNYGSCATLVAELLENAGFDYNKDSTIASALYYGLYMDTNGFNELRHPSDRDLRDFAKYDAGMIQMLKNSHLSLNEMKIAGDALKHYKFNEEYHFALVEAMPCDPNILGFISDLLVQVAMVDTCVVFCCLQFGTKLSVRSCVKDIRANEMIEYLVHRIGSGGGHAQKSGGYISEAVRQDTMWDFLSERLVEYFNSYQIIHAAQYTLDITKMKKYRKLPVTVGVVRMTDLLPSGTEICIRSLEADLNVCVDEQLYVMVGIRGEVYPIQKEKFDRSYQMTNRTFRMKTDYKPNVIVKKNQLVMNLIPFIRTCVTKGDTIIFASQLSDTKKVYTEWDEDNYMLGKPGDFIAARLDDPHDIYIIREDIFHETYEEISP